MWSSLARRLPAGRAAVALLALALPVFAPRGSPADPPAPFTLRSDAFGKGEAIPTRFTCEGENLSPPLRWSESPPGTRSFALIVDDPDAPDPEAPRKTWVHWVLYNLPAASRELPEAADRSGLPGGTRPGKNDWGRRSYGGPCPPIGRHRYFFKLYALDVLLADLGAGTRIEVEKAMRGHLLGRAELVGTYQKRGH